MCQLLTEVFLMVVVMYATADFLIRWARLMPDYVGGREERAKDGSAGVYSS
jgi:hypothetical protein